MGDIHPTASVDSGARLAAGVRIGAYAVIEAPVEIGAGSVIGPHVVIHPYVRLGRDNRVHAHAVLGDLPQDVAFEGGETWLEIGDRNLLREHVTAHRASSPERVTRIGSDCFLMAGAHVGHDCQVGDRVVLTNNALLGGRVEVGERANLGGGVAVHQFCRIGALAMVGGYAGVNKDVLPFSLAFGNTAQHFRLNTVGLRRAGVTGDRYRALERAFRALRTGDRKLSEVPETPEIALLRDWLAAPSKRGIAGWTSPRGRRV